jgi:FkbM family methyltransferase
MGLRSVRYKDYEIWFNNQQEFETLFQEIFVNQIYQFESDNSNPQIIDCGSHIGLSVLYFKMLYPGSSIMAFEPDKESFRILERNIEANKLKNVKAFNLALSDSEGQLPFYRESSPKWDSCGNSTVLEWGDRNGFNEDHIKGVLLSEYLSSETNFLKMDIEGAEMNVLKSIEKKIHLIREIALEYHIYDKTSEKGLQDILSMMSNIYENVSHSFFNLDSIMPDRYKGWVEKYKPVIYNIRCKNVKN